MRSRWQWVGGIVVAAVSLAAGMALGNGPLHRGDQTSPPGASTSPKARLTEQLATARSQQRFDSAVGALAVSTLVKGRLGGYSVAVVQLPGATDAATQQVLTAVQQAGAPAVTQVRVAPAFVDPGQKTYVASVDKTVVSRTQNLGSLASADPYQTLAAMFARAYAGTGRVPQVDDTATRINAQLVGARLVSVGQHWTARGSLVVVLAAGTHDMSPAGTATAGIEQKLVTALMRAASGVVVVAPPGGSIKGGLLALLASQRLHHLTTLNAAGTPASGVATVYALAAVAGGTAGNYGVRGAKAVLPPGLSP